ncbi:conjugal transfer protein TrbF [Caulobacter sp. Root1455]|uniref:conjugal transfer protein TrbF n=1 Tax=Caulobacter sp. Root1455 TaxID=1736465 RepID=UPI0006FF6A69|nr:conjugal transfer protein TrbF [Caulobacter sp. Root1455]KQY91829.1 conjugal transfer protein TrbF [Caulobacter sp. Root1455]
MLFKRSPQRYGRTPPPETPYQVAGQLWDERIGSARVQAYNWRLAFFGALTLSCGLAGGVMMLALQSKITPYVVEVDRLGEVRAVGPAEQNYQPSDAQVARELRQFIVNVRSLSSDGVVVRQRWNQAYDYATKTGQAFLDSYARANEPLAGFGEKTVLVQPTSVVRATSTSFQVRWTEQTFERGALAKTERWTAILTLKRQAPKTRGQLEQNPLGLYVDGVDWAQEADSAAATPRASDTLAPPPAVVVAPPPATAPAPPSPLSAQGEIQP